VERAAVIYFVRHAKAGERRLWEGDDVDRPLSKTGWIQSTAVARRLAKKDVAALYASPYIRCMQTLEPLGDLTGLKVQADRRLFEGEPFEPVLDLLNEVEDDWSKASVWVLRRKGSRITKGKVWPAPKLAAKSTKK
jgi:8-oxo-dGTP diphosphatase